MISQSDKKRFRAIAHRLKPIVTVAGKGLSENVVAEIERCLSSHELIKIKLVIERDERPKLVDEICGLLGAERVQAVGGVAVIFRASPKPDPELSNLLRHTVL